MHITTPAREFVAGVALLCNEYRNDVASAIAGADDIPADDIIASCIFSLVTLALADCKEDAATQLTRLRATIDLLSIRSCSPETFGKSKQ
jgi:hypothetical protein